MGKISPVSAKYIIHSSIDIEGVVDRPDVIGAIFGQTEGLLGSDLELRELQRSGRIGRIEVNVNTSSGKTQGEITIPSSLDKSETAIVGAALEVIQRIGPCNAKIEVSKIEDVRVSKRNFVIERAKKLLKDLTENSLPDSQELADEVAQSVRVMEIQEYGKERLPAGPNIDDSDEVIVVEGRADVLNLLKHGIKNCISINGTSVPQTIKELSTKKILTAFVDGDRGGDLIIKELLGVAEIDFVCKAPDGKEVEEITKKEIHKALRGKIAAEQAKLDLSNVQEKRYERNDFRKKPILKKIETRPIRKIERTLNIKEKEKFKEILDDLMGTRGAYILDEALNVMGKVPTTELNTTIRNVSSGIYAVILDGAVDQELIRTAERVKVQHIVGSDTRAVRNVVTRINIVTDEDL
ncbi:DNA primase [Candidatus Woesearchaeota archaeon]|nr:DNA primase [Candidatus Woesearchaeota archaeon]